MNVVFSPALASLFAAAADSGFLCLEGTCLFGWAWTLAALTLLSAAAVQRWHSGGEADLRRLVRASASSSAPAQAGAPLPRLPGLASPTRAPSVRPLAEPAAFHSLRDPPPTFDKADSAGVNPADLPSTPPRRPDRRSPGTPAQPDCPAGPGQHPPA